jgi:exonuclease SbcD
MLGRDVAVMTSTLADPDAWDYVALGHIHYFQDMNRGYHPPVVYSGSIERIDFGEEHDPKGFVWAEVACGNCDYDFVELAARPFVTIRVDVRDTPDPMAKILTAINGQPTAEAVVRVIIRATPELEPLLRDKEITDSLSDAAYIAALQRDIEYPVRARLGVENVEGLEPLELLGMYLRNKDFSPERIAALKEAAHDLIHADEG